MASKRKRLMRAALTQATEKYAVGGRLKTKFRPITLAGKVRPRGRRAV